jgi:hypothetical protein
MGGRKTLKPLAAASPRPKEIATRPLIASKELTSIFVVEDYGVASSTRGWWPGTINIHAWSDVRFAYSKVNTAAIGKARHITWLWSGKRSSLIRFIAVSLALRLSCVVGTYE